VRIPRFWHREFVEVVGRGGVRWRLSCWGWSAQSAEEARERAAAKGERIKERWKPGGARQDASWYSLANYLADPPREEVVEEIADEAGSVVGLVTRNAYGALILNTDRMVIVDVDERPKSLWGALTRWLRSCCGWPVARSREDGIVEAIAADRENAYRLYRTAAGWRVLLVSRAVDGVDEAALDLLRRFDVDEYYLKLCRRQKTFRARLTAKPWRCGCPRAPHRFPREEPEAIRAFEAWEAEYSRHAIQYRVCRLIRGNDAPIAPNLAALVRLHDSLSQTTSEFPLA
jgi:hypothetical protein